MTFSAIPNATPLATLWRSLEESWPLDAAVAAALEELDNNPSLNPETRDRLRAELAFRPTAQARWERRLREFLIERLTQLGGHLVLAHDQLAPKAVAPELMRYVDTAALRAGTFRALDHRLESLREYDGARVYIPNDMAARLRTSSTTSAREGTEATDAKTAKPKVGRPLHPAQERYIEFIIANEGTRGGRSVKEVQDMIRTQWGIAPPSPRALHDWEKIAKRRLVERPTE